MIADIIASLPPDTETGTIPVMHLKRYWAKTMAKKDRTLAGNSLPEEWKTDNTLLSVLGLGLEQVYKFLYERRPTFEEFENWIIKMKEGRLPIDKINLFNDQLSGRVAMGVPTDAKALTDEDIDFWNKNGYVIVRGAVPVADCEATIEIICDFLELDRNDPSTWYHAHPDKQGIMVQLFQHPQLQKNRESKLIQAAYEQLWGRKDIWLNTDRVGFNPPETAKYVFPGPNIHWDVSLELPIPFGTQGILYLSDTEANQGAFTLVPGFQNIIEEWMARLPEGANPREQDFYALGAMPVVARAGDFIIWHHALPHGASPNRSSVPRIVQYLNYSPLDQEIKAQWK